AGGTVSGREPAVGTTGVTAARPVEPQAASRPATARTALRRTSPVMPSRRPSCPFSASSAVVCSLSVMVKGAMSARPRAVVPASILGAVALLAACSSGGSGSAGTTGPVVTEAAPANTAATSVVSLPPTVAPSGTAPTTPAPSAGTAPPTVATSIGTNAD